MQRESLSEMDHRNWAEIAVRIVNAAFRFDRNDVRTWTMCTQLLPHALTVSEHAQALQTADEVTGRLLNKLGGYLYKRAQFADAKSAFERVIAIYERAILGTCGNSEPASRPEG